VRLFDRKKFFEAHELFEQLWKSEEADAADRDFWKAITQVCVGFCHVQRGNASGARSVLDRAARKLDRYPSAPRSIDAQALAASARSVARKLAAGANLDDLEFRRFPRA
jgi:predicted metal-dependent hydrolase